MLGSFPFCIVCWMERRRWYVAGRWTVSWLISLPTSWPVPIRMDRKSSCVRVFVCVLEVMFTCMWRCKAVLDNTIWLKLKNLAVHLFSHLTISLLLIPASRCCNNTKITPDLSRSVLRYSCSLNVTDPALDLQLELKPTRSAKSFSTSQHSEWT